MSLLSQPGSTHDEAYHARSIWCGHGERIPYCTERYQDSELGFVARTNIEFKNCQVQAATPLLCPSDRTGESVFPTDGSLYPDLFYFVMSWLVTPSVDISIVLMRVFNSLITTIFLGTLMFLLPKRHRLALALTIVTTFSATGYFLFASINPSSWTSLGIGTGWLAFHASILEKSLTPRRRKALFGIGTLLTMIAVGSRPDAVPYAIFVFFLVSLLSVFSQIKQRNIAIPIVSTAVTLLFGVLFLRFVESLFPDLYRPLHQYTAQEPDNTAFFTHYLLYGPINAVRALGTVPTMEGIPLPDMVFLINFSILFVSLAMTYNSRARHQQIGFVASVIAITVFVMLQVALVNNRDTFGVEPRYVFPLFLFSISWWFLNGVKQSGARLGNLRRPIAYAVTFSFFLTAFTIAERFVDRPTFGLRYLPEGPDQWWWTWMPIGPNVVLIFAVAAIWHFLNGLFSIAFLDSGEPKS